jgi:hypothetical protein
VGELVDLCQKNYLDPEDLDDLVASLAAADGESREELEPN